jgi:hypothetical protein
VLRIVAAGKSNRETARMLWVTDDTVKFHLAAWHGCRLVHIGCLWQSRGGKTLISRRMPRGGDRLAAG